MWVKGKGKVRSGLAQATYKEDAFALGKLLSLPPAFSPLRGCSCSLAFHPQLASPVQHFLGHTRLSATKPCVWVPCPLLPH